MTPSHRHLFLPRTTGPRVVEFPCPSCGRPMDAGFLVAESYIEGVKWMHEKTKLALGGDPIQKPDAWGNVYIAGLRCTGCRLVTVRY